MGFIHYIGVVNKAPGNNFTDFKKELHQGLQIQGINLV